MCLSKQSQHKVLVNSSLVLNNKNHKEFNWIQWSPKEVQTSKNQKNTDNQLPAF